MKKMVIFCCAALLTSCFWGAEDRWEYRLVDDLWLTWWADESDTQLIYAWEVSDHFDGGTPLVESTVFAAAYNRDFILLKRHPNKIREVQERLWGSYDQNGCKLADPGDTIYFDHRTPGDSIFQREGQWYHNVGGWTPPDSLRSPYRRVTYYYLLDLRAARADTVSRLEALKRSLAEYDSEEVFREACRNAGVPDSLQFTVRIETME